MSATKRLTALLLVLTACISVLGSVSVSASTAVRTVDLYEAVKSKEISCTGKGISIQKASITIKNDTNQKLSVVIDWGTGLIPNSTAVQNMIITDRQTITLEAKKSKTLQVNVACLNIQLSIPKSTTAFTVGKWSNGIIPKVLKLLKEKNADYPTRQAAIWIAAGGANFQSCKTLVSNGTPVITAEKFSKAQEYVYQAADFFEDIWIFWLQFITMFRQM
jgi:hypothetical protein